MARLTKAERRARREFRSGTSLNYPKRVLRGVAKPHTVPSREVLDARAAMVAKAYEPGTFRARGIDRTARMGIAYRGAA